MHRFFRFKTLVCLLAIIGVLCFSPDQIFSQGPGDDNAPQVPQVVQPKPAQPPAVTGPAPVILPNSLPAPGGRTTTSLPPPGVKKEPEPIPIKGTYEGFGQPSLVTQAVVLSLLSLLPFIIMILTSFMKIVIVLSLLRSALGVQQAPPNQILNGVAFMLSLFIMYPTAVKMYDAAQVAIGQQNTPESLMSRDATTYIIKIAAACKGPAADFLKANSSAKHQALFYRLAFRTLPEEYRNSLQPTDFMILVPSYITSQLKDAFEIGVLIYIPFFVIDLVTSNILLAMGMMMLSPVTISMPLKLFLLVMLDGWTLLVEGLVSTFH